MSGERLKLFIPALLWAAIIFIVSSIPNLKTPALDFKAGDKLAHFFEFFILGIFLAYALNRMDVGKRKAFWISACLAGLYGIFDEIHQLLVPGRLMDGWDMLADIMGAFAASGIFISKFWKRQ
jgi:VanZ family protein